MGDLREDQSSRIVIINIITLVIALLAVVLRLISRRLSAAPFWWDDGLIIVALFLNFGSSAFNFTAAKNGAGKHQSVVPPNQLIKLAQIIYGIEILYPALLTAIKSSILLLYYRLFSVRKPFRITIYICETIVICWGIALFFASIFQSSPPKYLWTPDLKGAHHINFYAYLTGTAVPNVVMDFVILVLPLYIVWNLQISRKRKVALSGVFAVGTFVCIVSIVRAYEVSQVKNSDKSFSEASTLIWSAVEANVGITCACLPILQPVLQKAFGKVMSSMGSDGSKYSKETPRAALRAAPRSSHDTLEGSNRPFARMNEETVRIPPTAVPANSTWVSSSRPDDLYEYQMEDHGASDIPMNAIHVKNDVNLERAGQV